MGGRATAARLAFRDLHAQGCFVLPNPWDIGSLRRLEKLGFEAVASTSAGFAWSAGFDDLTLTRDAVLGHLRALCAATDLPVNADFEAGFADDPAGVAANVVLALDTGVAGLSIEDRKGDVLYDKALAVERIAAARAAIDGIDRETILVGRSEGFLIGQKDLAPTIQRLVAYAEAGADCLYAPGFSDPVAIREIVQAVAPKPVNVLLTSPVMRMADLAELGVRRVSTGSRLAFAAWTGFDAAARMLQEDGALPGTSFKSA
ncbi:isocitrate lyase/PEP mutase family protein [Methylobacterium brachythecii]|uniref:2-methylisocitrate lyase n=1 Tax=Methylobacterium brachythecii TaxID=1176177 RepID=A0A7W6AIH9_9HYPH|nr:isocitrate lyase/phosphoenolpyruvate mutase family protein [Methylobacterium brachythecii]MBB3903343.1 2-methylisocitrate lyase-like PEP mutase family enzyme [Methylobacterium brachythecii]GLS45424.1 2-methylisocitrate lyase [Methylobacterium brachythecii]